MGTKVVQGTATTECEVCMHMDMLAGRLLAGCAR